jgi:uncharacterized protein HemX
MDRIAGPIVAIAVIIAIGAGVYGFTQHQQLIDFQAKAVAAEQRAATAEQQSQDQGRKVTDTTASLTTCQAQLQEANAAAESAQTKSGGGKRR